MPEHLIRLRGPWEIRSHDDPAPSRITLPVAVLPASSDRRILLRRFGRPIHWEADVPSFLRIDEVPGVIVVSLNGEVMYERKLDDSGPIQIRVGHLLRVRNVLELTVAPGPERSGASGLPWGSVALLFGRDEGPGG